MKQDIPNDSRTAYARFAASLPEDGSMTVEQLEQLQKLAQAMLNEYSNNISALMLATAGVDLDAGAKIARNVPAVKAWDVYKLGVSEGYAIENIRVEPDFVSSAKEFLAEALPPSEQQQSLAA